MNNEAKQEIGRLLREGRKIDAIKYARETFDISLQDAKTLVEAAERDLALETYTSTIAPATAQISNTLLDGDLKLRVTALLLIKKKIEAVKLVKTELKTTLKEALTMVEEVHREVDPNYKAANLGGCFGGGFKLISFIFGFIGIGFLAVAGFTYYFQTKDINNSELVKGRVIDFRYSNKGGSAPVISYQIKGKDHFYYSTTYSSPAAYDLNEDVEVYVNKDNADDAIVNTFSDRWFLIFIFGIIGGVFTAFTIGFSFIGSKVKV